MTLEAIRKNTLEEAMVYARIESMRQPKMFFYIVWSTLGFYLIDFVGIIFSDENLIETYKNGVLVG